MAKGKNTTIFFCQSCGYESSKWMGQCPGCREWNTFVEETAVTGNRMAGIHDKNRKSAGRERPAPAALSEISLEEEDRMTTRMQELDRVLGGGLVRGSLTLVGGDPGIGKSTLLLQVCRNLAIDGREVLYVSGEESLKQIKPSAFSSLKKIAASSKSYAVALPESFELSVGRTLPLSFAVNATEDCLRSPPNESIEKLCVSSLSNFLFSVSTAAGTSLNENKSIEPVTQPPPLHNLKML